MIRTQISLTEAQLRRLRLAAQRRGISMAAVIREAVDTALDDDPDDRDRRWELALEAVGAHSSEREKTAEPVAREHDRYLAEAFGGTGMARGEGSVG